MNLPVTQTDRYLGDGVYLSFDGYQLWIAVNHHLNKVVAIEPEVFINLIQEGNKFFEGKYNGNDT